MKNIRGKLLPFPFFVAVTLLAFCLIAAASLAENLPETLHTRQQGAAITRGIIILVEFPDVKHAIDRAFVHKRFAQQLHSYIKEMSYGKVSLGIEVTKRWYTMPNSINQYRISSRNLEVDTSSVRRLIDDALDAADAEIDFSKYDFTVIFMGATLTDYGMIGLCGYPGMLGWHAQDVLKTRTGQLVNGGVAIFSFQAHLGTLFHDIAHILGGVKGGKRMVPCLYDHDLQARKGPLRETFVDATINMGFWDPMSCHFYERQKPPPGISSWTRIRLNWLDPAKVKVVQPDQKTVCILGPLEDGTAEILAIKIPLSKTTYYLIENRQSLGYDKNLPGHGILVLYGDDSIAECRHGRAPVRLIDANPSVPHLEGAAFDIGGKDSFRDNRNRMRIHVQEKIGDSYRVVINPL